MAAGRPRRQLRQIVAALRSRQQSAAAAVQASGSLSQGRTVSAEPQHPSGPTAAETFLFDMQGFLLLPSVLSPAEVETLRTRLYELEAADYPDAWMDAMGLDRAAIRPTKQNGTKDFQGAEHVVQLNGLPKIDHSCVFDTLIAHPHVLPYLDAFVGDPQLVNTWSLSKRQGAGGETGGWHGGLEPRHYAVDVGGQVRTQMLNVVYSLTDNGPGDGEMAVMPGSHKSNFPFAHRADLPTTEMPGSQHVHTKAGDVLLMSEAVQHTGLQKATPGVRTNLYYNYVDITRSGMSQAPMYGQHHVLPETLRARLTEDGQRLTRWCQWARWDY